MRGNKSKFFSLLIGLTLIFNNVNATFGTEINTTTETEVQSTEQDELEDTETGTESEIILEEDELGLVATSAILMEKSTGKILYEKNANAKMYPASMTKILTAILATEYLDMDKLYVAGYEINEIPIDSSRADNKVGESILGYNLIRGLIIPSGNETANIVAKQVALIHENREEMEYSQAQSIFMELMNEKAKSLGALNTNFTTPHGYHDDNHYTTAYDMALITKYAMDDEVIRAVAAEDSFVGNGAGDQKSDSLLTNDYQWYTHNYLIQEGSEYYYENSDGMKTGFTDQAGSCVAATATKDGVELIAIVMNSGDTERWNDAKTLFEYGFDNYSMHQLQTSNSVIDSVSIENPQLGATEKLDVKSNKDVTLYLTEEEKNSIFYRITYNPEVLSEEVNEDGQIKLKAPITEGTEIGQIKYYTQINGEEVVYEDYVLADSDVLIRTLKSDVDYYLGVAKSIIFSWKIIPIIIVVATIIILITRTINKRRRKYMNRRKKYTFRSKY